VRGETVADRLNAASDEFGRTAEQRDRIRAIRADLAAKYRAQRAARRDLRQEELRELGSILTPEQRDHVNSFADEREEPGQER
jgi:Spy/CpxP family protein refolding chaperone